MTSDIITGSDASRVVALDASLEPDLVVQELADQELANSDLDDTVELTGNWGHRRRDDRPVLPSSTRDDTDAGWGERPSENDTWLRDQRPPHWD